MRVIVRTVVIRVISFFNLSKKMLSTPCSSAPRWSPRWHTMWPIQEIARSFTSWSMSVALSLFRVEENTLNRKRNTESGTSASAFLCNNQNQRSIIVPLWWTVWGRILLVQRSDPAVSSLWPAAVWLEEPLRWFYKRNLLHRPRQEAAASAQHKTRGQLQPVEKIQGCLWTDHER